MRHVTRNRYRRKQDERVGGVLTSVSGVYVVPTVHQVRGGPPALGAGVDTHLQPRRTKALVSMSAASGKSSSTCTGMYTSQGYGRAHEQGSKHSMHRSARGRSMRRVAAASRRTFAKGCGRWPPVWSGIRGGESRPGTRTSNARLRSPSDSHSAFPRDTASCSVSGCDTCAHMPTYRTNCKSPGTHVRTKSFAPSLGA